MKTETKIKLSALGALVIMALCLMTVARADCVTNADGSVTCGTPAQIGGQTNGSRCPTTGCDYNNPQYGNSPFHNPYPDWPIVEDDNKPRWDICINGISLKTGHRCSGHDWDHNWLRPHHITATGHDAIEVLQNMRPIYGFGFDAQGYFRQLGVYNGYYRRAHGRVFRCTVDPNGYNAVCNSLN